jgi:hypothetical protein
VKECVRVSQRLKVTLKNITVEQGRDGDELELFGSIVAKADSTLDLFRKTSDQHIKLKDGEVFPQNAVLSQGVLAVTPQPGSSLRLEANLRDRDPVLGDDDVGNEGINIPFETGWRREIPMTVTGSGARIKLLFSVEPM